MVGHALKHYSAVDVTVVGEAITEEIPYKVSINNINPNPSFLDMLGMFSSPSLALKKLLRAYEQAMKHSKLHGHNQIFLEIF